MAEAMLFALSCNSQLHDTKTTCEPYAILFDVQWIKERSGLHYYIVWCKGLIGSVWAGSIHAELRPDPNSTWTDWAASHFLGSFRVEMAKNVQPGSHELATPDPLIDIFGDLNLKQT